MSDAPEIKVKLTAEDTGVSAAIKELGAQLKNLKKSEDEAAGGASNLAKAFQGIAAAGALLGFAKIGKDAFDSAVGISHMADKTGLTTQTLSVFHKIAGDVGASTEGIDKALIKATKSITEFQQGTGKSASAFAMLGIAAEGFPKPLAGPKNKARHGKARRDDCRLSEIDGPSADFRERRE